jgi:hypothetical protein
MSEAQAQTETAVAASPAAGLWALSTDQRRFFFWHAIVGAAIVNLSLSALIAG